MKDNRTSRERGEQYIIDEREDLSFGASSFLRTFFSAFPAFKHRNYRLYFLGQLISMAGMWLQRVAQGWLIYQLTHSAFWVGTTAALGLLPLLFFTLPGGVIVDRFPKKKILYFTQAVAMILAFLLYLVTITNNANVFTISLLAFLLGLVDCLDKPARQAFVIELVGKEDLPSAIALNAGIFNGARVLGPAIAGFIIGIGGVSMAFLINAISFIPILFALYQVRVREEIPKEHPHPLMALKEGISFAYAHRAIRYLLLFIGGVSIFGWSYTTLLPVVAQSVFNMDATGLGYLYAVSGAGAVLATAMISTFSKEVSVMRFIVVGCLLFSFSTFLFSLTRNVVIAYPLLFLAGFGLVIQFSVINSLIQYMVPNEMRGRIMSLFVLMAVGTSPIGNFQIGILAEYFGTVFAIAANAVAFLICGLALFLKRKEIYKAYKKEL